jgi:hypothetical protein
VSGSGLGTVYSSGRSTRNSCYRVGELAAGQDDSGTASRDPVEKSPRINANGGMDVVDQPALCLAVLARLLRRNPQPASRRDCRDQLDAVAADLAEAAFWNAGQNCSTGSRILVQSSIKEEFTALAREANKRIVGDPTDDATAIGPLIEPSALDRVLGYVQHARADGAASSPAARNCSPRPAGTSQGPPSSTTLSDLVRLCRRGPRWSWSARPSAMIIRMAATPGRARPGRP